MGANVWELAETTMTGNPPLQPLDADGRAMEVGNQVVIICIPHWLTHDLPAEDQASLKTFEGEMLPIHEIDVSGYVWFSTEQGDFCLRPEEVRRV